MRVLVVDDEAEAAGYLLRGLGEHGYVVDVPRDWRNTYPGARVRASS